MTYGDVAHVHLEETTPWVRRWLRAEGIAGLALGWVARRSQGGELLWFVPLLLVPLLLVPDVSMVGYLGGNHTGAITYNIAHNWFVGGLVLGLGWWLSVAPLALAGAVLVAHRVATADPARQRRGKQLPEGAADVADELDLGLVLRASSPSLGRRQRLSTQSGSASTSRPQRTPNSSRSTPTPGASA